MRSRELIGLGLIGLVIGATGLALGCGTTQSRDPSAFFGVYTSTSHTGINGYHLDCNTVGSPLTNREPYFKIAIDTFFNDPNIVALSGCTDINGTNCTETATTMELGGPGLETVAANSQTGGGLGCQLHWSRNQATLTGPSMHLELLEKYDDPAISDADCSYEKAAALGDMATTCSRIERWDGTRH